MNQKLTKLLGLLFLFPLLCAAEIPVNALNDGFNERGFTDWISIEDYQKSFDEKVADGYFPIYVETAENASRRSIYVKLSNDVRYAVRNGLALAAFKEFLEEYRLSGFKLLSVHAFKTQAGVMIYSGVWVNEKGLKKYDRKLSRLGIEPLPKNLWN